MSHLASDHDEPTTAGTEAVTIPISGMTCAACSSRIERSLSRTPGVIGASVNLMLRQAARRGTFDAGMWSPIIASTNVERTERGDVTELALVFSGQPEVEQQHAQGEQQHGDFQTNQSGVHQDEISIVPVT